jgi:hypothetical protein
LARLLWHFGSLLSLPGFWIMEWADRVAFPEEPPDDARSPTPQDTVAS